MTPHPIRSARRWLSWIAAGVTPLLLLPPTAQSQVGGVVEGRVVDADGLMATTMRPLNRGDLLRLKNSTLREVIRARFAARYRRVRCVVLDEEALTPGMAAGVLQTTLASEVERMEFLFRGAMLRVYTREFMSRMLGGGIELRGPTYVDMADPPFCG